MYEQLKLTRLYPWSSAHPEEDTEEGNLEIMGDISCAAVQTYLQCDEPSITSVGAQQWYG